MTDPGRSALPWTLVAASVLLIASIVYLLFAAYLPTKRRMLALEAELHQLYTREAELHTRLEREVRARQLREHELAGATAHRDALARRVQELQRQLAARPPRRPSP